MERPKPAVHTRPLHLVTALRALLLLVLAGVVVGTAFTWGRRSKPQAAITMTESGPTAADRGPVVDQSDRFEANGTREGRPAFDLLAQTVTGFQGDRKVLQDVQLTVHEDSGGTIQVASQQGHFDPSARRAQLSRDVAIRTPDGLSLETGDLFYDSDRDIIYTGDTIRFSLGRIEGRGQGMNYLVNERQIKIASRVSLTISAEDDGPPVRITAGSLVASLEDNSAVFTESTLLERGPDRLRGNYLRIVLDQRRERVTDIRSYGDVAVTMGPNAAGKSSELRADSLTLTMGPGDIVETAESSGGCRFTSGPYTSTSRAALFRRADDRLELRGDPVVLTDRERIAAQEIDLQPAAQTLEARGDVRTVSSGDGRPSSPGFGSGSPVSFQASHLSAAQATRRAVYRGAARAWQEGMSIQAEEIVIDESARQLQATGNVMSRLTQRPTPSSPAGSRPVTTTITARRLVVDEAAGTARYEGDARLTHPEASLTAGAMTVHAKDIGRRREMDRIVAVGSVAAKHAGSLATAETAEFLCNQHLLILRDGAGLAEVVDAATGHAMRGRELTYDLNGERILTETSEGARTWITLTPDGKDGPSLEPHTRH